MYSQKNYIVLAPTVVSATGSTTFVGAFEGAIGGLFFANFTAKTGSPSIVLSIEVYDQASSTWNAIYTGSAITSNGMNQLLVYPAATGAVAQVLPANWRVTYTYSGSGSFTLSIGVTFLP